MRQVPGAALALILFTLSAQAEDRYLLRQDQSGLNLPGVTLPQGYDEVRAADGTSCRSSNTNGGAYADVGLIGSNDVESGGMRNGAVYGRVVIPLGQTGTRLDCRRLYDLEIQRLESEVRLLKAGLGRTTVVATATSSLETGWGNAVQAPGVDSVTTGAVAQPPAVGANAEKRRKKGGAPLRGSLPQ